MIAVEMIHSQQRVWAERHGIACDRRGYTVSLPSNLYSFPLLPETQEAFESGRAQELRSSAGQGRMRALHSSSALVVNFFEYWQTRDIAEIARACGAGGQMTRMRFERRYPALLGGLSPHIDVEFEGRRGRPLAVISKFLEPYRRTTRRQMGRQYLARPDLWRDLPRCERVARRISAEENVRTSYIHLDAPQLLKAIVGLNTRFGARGFQLLYLWYYVPSAEANRHQDEIREFARCLRGDVLLKDTTYQQVFEAIKLLPDVDAKYISYLTDRYFPAEVSGSGELPCAEFSTPPVPPYLKTAERTHGVASLAGGTATPT